MFHYFRKCIILPWSHLSPDTPKSHPFKQLPFTWWHGSPLLQLPHVWLHSRPYLLLLHSSEKEAICQFIKYVQHFSLNDITFDSVFWSTASSNLKGIHQRYLHWNSLLTSFLKGKLWAQREENGQKMLRIFKRPTYKWLDHFYCHLCMRANRLTHFFEWLSSILPFSHEKPLYPGRQPRHVPSVIWQWQFWGHGVEQDIP